MAFKNGDVVLYEGDLFEVLKVRKYRGKFGDAIVTEVQIKRCNVNRGAFWVYDNEVELYQPEEA